MKSQHPKDIGLVIATKREALFTTMLNVAKAKLEDYEEGIEAQKEVVKMCERIIQEEKKK